MKKIILVSLISLFYFGINAQVTLNHTYNFSASVVKLETLGYKYYLMDVPNAQCRIYNLDHSLYKTINCSVPANYFLADIKFISQNLFDTDDGIELAFTYYRYYGSNQYYEYNSKIINDDGSVITTIDGAQYLYVNKTADDTHKFFAYCFDYSVFPEKVWTKIYNLPGEPVVAAKIYENQSENLLKAFPNPAVNSVKVAYSLPEDIETGVLHLVDNSGRETKQFVVDNHTDYLQLNVSDFPAGLYHYFIEYNNTRTASKKLVIR